MAENSSPVEIRTLSPAQKERLRDLSKIVFGNKDRLEVAVAVARSPDGVVNATDLHEEIGLAQSRVRNQLVAMAEARLLVVASSSTDVKRWYRREDSPFWQLCCSLYDEWGK